jgi:hypothetical protein
MDDTLTAEHLAEVLQEPKIPLLRQVLRLLGPDRTTAALVDTLQVEANGGMLTKAGDRRRTPGGVFFQLVKERASTRERQRLFPRSPSQKPPAPVSSQGQPQGQASPQALTWDEVSPIIQTLVTAPAGEARAMKVTLIGRPGKVEVRQQCAVFRCRVVYSNSADNSIAPKTG